MKSPSGILGFTETWGLSDQCGGFPSESMYQVNFDVMMRDVTTPFCARDLRPPTPYMHSYDVHMTVNTKCPACANNVSFAPAIASTSRIGPYVRQFVCQFFSTQSPLLRCLRYRCCSDYMIVCRCNTVARAVWY